jgi:hypothetical protein
VSVDGVTTKFLTPNSQRNIINIPWPPKLKIKVKNIRRLCPNKCATKIPEGIIRFETLANRPVAQALNF